MKTGVKNDIFWSEIGSGFGEPGGTPPQRILRNRTRLEKPALLVTEISQTPMKEKLSKSNDQNHEGLNFQFIS